MGALGRALPGKIVFVKVGFLWLGGSILLANLLASEDGGSGICRHLFLAFFMCLVYFVVTITTDNFRFITRVCFSCFN